MIKNIERGEEPENQEKVNEVKLSHEEWQEVLELIEVAIMELTTSEAEKNGQALLEKIKQQLD